jgi:hypothetical protein
MSYEWAGRYPILTVMAVRGAAPEEIAARFGVSHGVLRERELPDVVERAFDGPAEAWLVFEPYDDVVLVWEQATMEARRRPVAEAVSRDAATVFAAHHNEKEFAAFVYAADGQVIAEASSLVPSSPRLPPELAGLDPTRLQIRDCLAAMATLFGVEPVPPEGETDVLSCRVTPYPATPRPSARPSVERLGRSLGTIRPLPPRD